MDPELLLVFTGRELAKILRAHARQLEAEAGRLEDELASARAFSLASIRALNDVDMVRVATEVVRRLRDGDLRGVLTSEVQVRRLRAEAARSRVAAKHLLRDKQYEVRYGSLPFSG